nr:rhodanese-like domain-containing protein [Neisseria wadsworthii]
MQAKTPQASVAPAGQAAKAKGIWIDVRTPEEFKTGNIEGALNIPVDQITGRIHSVSPDKHAPINLYCRSGRRAEIAIKQLQDLGYTDITNHGGYQDLRRQGIR